MLFCSTPFLRLLVARGVQCGLVDDVGEVGAGEAGRESREALGEDVGLLVEDDALHVLLQDLLALHQVRQVDLDVPVQSAGAQQGLVEYV